MATAETVIVQNPGATAQDRWAFVANVPCQIAVDFEIPIFRLSDLASLKAGSVVDTQWSLGSDIPLRLNGQLVAWCEFEVSGGQLAVRLTELA